MKFSAASAFLIAALFITPLHADSFDDLAAKAAAARDADQIPQALELYHQALQLKPAWAEGWWFLGTLLYDSDQYAPGRDAFARFVKLQDNAPPGFALLGLCEFQLAAYPDALSHLQKALSSGSGLEPQVEQVVRFHEAMTLTRLGLFDQAIHEYLWFPAHNVKEQPMLLGLGLASLRTALIPKELSADQAPLMATAGAIAYAWMSGDLANADAGFHELIAHYPTAPNVHYFYGSFLLDTHPVEALAELERELQNDPGNAYASGLLALTMVRSGHQDEAESMARKAATNHPEASIAQYVYGLILSRSGDKSALEYLEKATQLDPVNIDYHVALAGAYSKFGRNDDAYRERRATIALARGMGPLARH